MFGTKNTLCYDKSSWHMYGLIEIQQPLSIGMHLVFLHGPLAVGKLTIARELELITGFRLFHNHLTIDMVTVLFDFGSESFIRLRESIWLNTFEEAAKSGTSLIFTFQPESTVPTSFPEEVVRVVDRHGGNVVFVELECPEDEIENRVGADSRSEFGKLKSLPEYRLLRDSGVFDYPNMPTPDIKIDTSLVQPQEAALAIRLCLQQDIVS